MFNNCRLYNAPDTVFYKNATRLEAYFESKVAAEFPGKLEGANGRLTSS